MQLRNTLPFQFLLSVALCWAVQTTTKSAQALVPPHPAPAPPKLSCVDPVIKNILGTYTYPIHLLQGKILRAKAVPSGEYFLSMCADTSTGKPFCPQKDSVHATAMAGYCPISQVALAIASAHSVTTRSYTPLSATDLTKGLLLRVQPLNTVIKGGFEVQFVCDAKLKVPVFSGIMKQIPLGFNFTVRTSAACPTFVATPGGWSTAFLVIFCVVTFLYCGIGCFLNVQAGTNLTEACPHRSSWCNLPGLVKDGCLFFMQLLCGGDGGGVGVGRRSGGGGGGGGGGSSTTRGKGSGSTGNDKGGNYSQMKDDDGGSDEIGAAYAAPNYGSVTKSTPSAPPLPVTPVESPQKFSSSGRHNERNDDFADTMFDEE